MPLVAFWCSSQTTKALACILQIIPPKHREHRNGADSLADVHNFPRIYAHHIECALRLLRMRNEMRSFGRMLLGRNSVRCTKCTIDAHPGVSFTFDTRHAKRSVRLQQHTHTKTSSHNLISAGSENLMRSKTEQNQCGWEY